MLNFIPLDENNLGAGGKISGHRQIYDLRTLTYKVKPLFGIYGEDFVKYGTFITEGKPWEDEEYLLEITKDNSPHIGEWTEFKFDTDRIHFSHHVNTDVMNPEIYHSISESILIPETWKTWSERLYFGLAN